MSDAPAATPPDGLPQAVVAANPHGPRFSVVWLLPLVALMIGGWLVFKTITEEGPLISIRFANAEGIEPKKTRVKYRDVDVGFVEAVRFSADLSQVIVSVRLDKAFERRLTESTRFWVVRPRIEGLRISGLGTLISGAYITMDLGEGGKKKSKFDGLEEPHNIFSDTPGSFFTLRATGLGSLSLGAPVYFRQIAVGEVVNYRLVEANTHVEIEIFVRAPHDAMVRSNSRFWNVSGMKLDLSAEGVELGIESLTSLLVGGIAFRTLQSLDPGPRAKPGSVFNLYQSAEESELAPITVSQYYLLNFEDTLRGLSVGAPVEFHGVRVGTVTDIAFEADAKQAPMRTPVLIAIEPERVPVANPEVKGVFQQLSVEDKLARVRSLFERTVKQGLRARLETGNLLTGQMFVALDFVPDVEPQEVIYDGSYPELPTVPSSFQGITLSLSRLLAKLERLPLEEIGHHVEEAAAGANRLVNSDHLSQSLVRMDEVLVRLNRVLTEFETHTGPMMAAFAEAGTDARDLIAASGQAVGQAESTLASIEKTVSEDGPVGSEILKTLEELSDAARSIRVMAEYLERHPEALIKGKANY